ncbi:MAG: alpha/beta fold hydrolase [Planctomycetaceae bacterium]|nr:alpha/beta fold hydrolase [Planctomycetaceae bacterium]
MNPGSPDTKQPVIYFPGLDGTGRLLYRQQELLDTYDVQCESYPQDRPQTYEELADHAAEQLKANHPGESAIVLAESFGGAVAITFSLRHPELVERLVLVNTFARYPRRAIISLGGWLGKFFPARPSPPRTRPFRSYFFFPKDVPKSEQDEWWGRTADVPMKAFGYRLALISKLDLRSRLAEIPMPALVLAAPNDKVVHPRAGRELAKLLPHAKLLEMPVGHGAMVHPDVNIAQLLQDPSYWESDNASEMSTK